MRTLTRQFVLLFGTLLSFGSGDPLFAGMICIAPIDDPSADPLQARLVASDASNYNTAALQLALANVPEEPIRFEDYSLGLSGGSRDGFAPTGNPPCGSADSNGLDDDQGPEPAAPPPAKPPAGGGNGVTGAAPTTGPSDQQFGLAASTVAPARQGEGEANLWYLPPATEHHALPLFRPPR